MFFMDWFAPKDPDQLYRLIWDQLDAEYYDKALKLLGKLERISPDWDQVYYTKGLCLEKSGAPDEAKETYQYALSLNPDNTECIYNLARLYYETGETEIAQAYAEHAKSLATEAGGDAQLSYLLGAIYEEKSEFDLAIVSYEEARALDAENFIGRAFLANLYVILQDYDKAITIYQELLEREPKNLDAWYEMSLCRAKEGNWQEAINCCDKVIEIDKKYAQAYNQKGLAYYCIGNLDKAIKNYRKALDIQSDYATAINNLAYAYERKGELRDAIIYFTKYLPYTEDRPVERAEIQEHIGALKQKAIK